MKTKTIICFLALILIFSLTACTPENIEPKPDESVLEQFQGTPALEVETGEVSTVSNSFAFCTHDLPLLPASLPRAEGILVLGRENAEYFVAPSGVNIPSDIVTMGDGRIFIASSRANAVLELGEDGLISTYSTLMVYALDNDAQGNLYGYFFPSGQVYQIKPGSESKVIANLPQTACESTMAVGPNSEIYIGLNLCGTGTDQSSIYSIPAGGGEPRLLTVTGREGLLALDVDKNGSLFATIGSTIQKVDTSNGNSELLATLPDWPSYHGLAVSDSGDFYVSFGDFADSGKLIRVSKTGMLQELSVFINNGLEGLAITRQGDVLGVQRAIGGVQLVRPDGSTSELVKPNGLTTPQALAFSRCGELFVVNDESGRLTVAEPDGEVRPSFQIISFQPPQTFLAFSPAGWFVTGESAPGFPSRVNQYFENGDVTTLTESVAWASGVAVDTDGSIYVSATQDGKILRLLESGELITVAEGLQTPQSLAKCDTGTLFVVTGGESAGEVFSMPMVGNAITSISTEGQVRQIANIDHAAQITCGPDGWAYVAASGGIYRVNEDGMVQEVASGFKSPRGVAFDQSGNLYVSEEGDNCIILIRKENLD